MQQEDVRIRRLSEMLSTDWRIEDQMMGGSNRARLLAGELDFKLIHGEHLGFAGCEVVNLRDQFQPKLLQKHVLRLLRFYHSDRQMGSFLVCCIDGSAERFAMLFSKYAEDMRRFDNDCIPRVIEDPIVGGVEVASDRIRMVQCLFPDEQNQELWLIFVRFGN